MGVECLVTAFLAASGLTTIILTVFVYPPPIAYLYWIVVPTLYFIASIFRRPFHPVTVRSAVAHTWLVTSTQCAAVAWWVVYAELRYHRDFITAINFTAISVLCTLTAVVRHYFESRVSGEQPQVA